jgi:hypothetical protein
MASSAVLFDNHQSLQALALACSILHLKSSTQVKKAGRGLDIGSPGHLDLWINGSQRPMPTTWQTRENKGYMHTAKCHEVR